MGIKQQSVNDKMKLMEKSGDFKRLEKIHAEAGAFIAKGTIAVQMRVELPSRFADLQRVHVLVKDAAKIVGKYSACVEGCSACCHQAITITEPEAALIGKTIGRAPALVPPVTRDQFMSGEIRDRRLEEVKQYTGKPCPFLVNDRCSVYAVRPVICRLHHSMHSDNSLCQHDEVHEVPAIDFRALEGAFVITQQSYTAADIRDFFPILASNKHEIEHP